MKTKLTPQLQERICDLISKGNYIERSCEAVGITRKTYFEWLQKATKENPPSIYSAFSDAIKKTEAEAQAFILNKVQEVGAKSWQAWMTIAERRWASEWSQSSRGNVSVDVTHNIVSLSELARSYDSPQLQEPAVEGEFKEIATKQEEEQGQDAVD